MDAQFPVFHFCESVFKGLEKRDCDRELRNLCRLNGWEPRVFQSTFQSRASDKRLVNAERMGVTNTF